MPTPAKLTKDKAAAVALRPETVEFFARVKALLGQRQESERLYAELCAAAPEAARRLETLSVEGDTERKQTTKTVDELFAQANAVLGEFGTRLEAAAAAWPGDVECKVAPLKRRTRVLEKMADDYADEKYPSQAVKDVVRGAIFVSSIDAVMAAYDGVAERFEVVRVKNRFANPTFCGFRDCLCNVDVEGHICEIQIHVTEVKAIAKRSDSHAHYEFFRSYFAGNEATVVAQRMDVLERWNNGGVDADAVLELCADATANEDELRAVWSLLRQMCEVGLARTVATALVGARAPAACEALGEPYRPVRHATLLVEAAEVEVLGGAYDLAETLYVQAEEAVKDSTSVVADCVQNTARGGRAKAARLAGDFERAYNLASEALAVAEKRRKAAPAEYFAALNTVAAAAGALADHDAKEKKSTAKKLYATAAEYLREVLAFYDADHVAGCTRWSSQEDRDKKVSAVSCNLAAVLASIGDDKALREAKNVAEDAIARRIRASGAEAIELAALRNNAATICHKLGELDDAINHMTAALGLTEKVQGEQHPAVARRAGNLGLLLQSKGDLEKAEASFVKALAVAEQNKDPYAAQARDNLDLLRREKSGAVSVHRGGGTAPKQKGTVLERGTAADVSSLADVVFPPKPDGAATEVAKLAKGKAALVKREVAVEGTRYAVFALYNNDGPESTVEITMKFAGSEGVTLVDEQDQPVKKKKKLEATASVEGGAVGIVVRLRLEPSNSLKFKIACSHKALQMAGGPMGGRGGGGRGRGRGGRGRRSKTSAAPAAMGMGSLYAGLE